MSSISIRRILHPMQTFILLGFLSLFAASHADAQTMSVTLSSTAPTNPIIGVYYSFTAIGSLPSPEGAEWGAVSFDSGVQDPITHLVKWESYGRYELFTQDPFNITDPSAFSGTPCYARATGYFILNSNSGISYYYSNILGLYSPI